MMVLVSGLRDAQARAFGTVLQRWCSASLGTECRFVSKMGNWWSTYSETLDHTYVCTSSALSC